MQSSSKATDLKFGKASLSRLSKSGEKIIVIRGMKIS